MTKMVEIQERLLAYLRQQMNSEAIEYEEPLRQLQGGFETTIYEFKLKNAPENLSQNLVLRLYPEYVGETSAIWESTVQNVLAKQGFTVARVHLLCSDQSILGGAFFIMDLLPGKLLLMAEQKEIPEFLGESLAKLHSIDPEPVKQEFEEHQISPDVYTLNRFSGWLEEWLQKASWTNDVIQWLRENQPDLPDRLALCHGDFHINNIIYDGKKVTGVLDWGGFALADPMYDIANAKVLMDIPIKHVSKVMPDIPSLDWEKISKDFLSSYQQHNPIDFANLDYYQVRRCVFSLIQGVEGQQIWQHPLIVNDLRQRIQAITGIWVELQ